MKTRELITLLSDGQFHSGEELGGLLGVSRTAVWKQLKKIEELGLAFESVKGKGYRLANQIELLDKPLIESRLSEVAVDRLKEIIILDDTDSTNSEALAACDSKDMAGTVWLAERQSGGRGRRGQQWHSPYGRNIYLSLVWGFSQGVAAIEGLSLAVGVAVRRAIVMSGITDIALKWPNDLLHKDKKVGGILLEVTGDPAGFCQVVIGIGLNVGMDKSAGQTIDQPWADLLDISEGRLSRNVATYNLLNQMVEVLTLFEQSGFKSFKDEWQASDNCRDKPVTLSTINNDRNGIARGVSDSGALLFEQNGKIEEISGGEVSLRQHRDA